MREVTYLPESQFFPTHMHLDKCVCHYQLQLASVPWISPLFNWRNLISYIIFNIIIGKPGKADFFGAGRRDQKRNQSLYQRKR